ncbi:GNAT family N-acetyltransferase [Nocardioides sp.]|uniref:GNAT family N-acetyltransferase n=1 Tax=Nocardioides sp. TaxID=35761 RepID=UPI002ED16426
MIEPATLEDVPAVAGLEAVCQGDDAWSEALVRQGVTGTVPTVRHLVAREEQVVGYAVVSVAGDVVELQRIGVEPARRRGGVATALLAAVVALASEEEADRVLLEVRDDNDGALGFYAATGFVEIARRPRYYRDGATAVVMELSLTRPDVKVWTTS